MAGEQPHAFKEGDKVWVEDGEGKHHPGIYVGENESAGWFGVGRAPTSPTRRHSRRRSSPYSASPARGVGRARARLSLLAPAAGRSGSGAVRGGAAQVPLGARDRVGLLPVGRAAIRPGPGYEDWYLVDDWSSLGRLNEAAVDAARRPAHDRAAVDAGAGWGASTRWCAVPRTRPGCRMARQAPPHPDRDLPRRSSRDDDLAPRARPRPGAQSASPSRAPYCVSGSGPDQGTRARSIATRSPRNGTPSATSNRRWRPPFASEPWPSRPATTADRARRPRTAPRPRSAAIPARRRRRLRRTPPGSRAPGPAPPPHGRRADSRRQATVFGPSALRPQGRRRRSAGSDTRSAPRAR